jgi:hypothetical protein
MASRGIPVSEAARRLGVNQARVRALLATEGLRGEKIGGRWLVDPESLERRERGEVLSGRPFSARTAWAALALAEGRPAPRLSAPARSRLRRWLREVGLEAGRLRLRRRARLVALRAHPSDLPRLRDEAGVVLTGVSAAPLLGADLAAGEWLEAYLAPRRYTAFCRRYSLVPSESPNLVLRVISGAWPFAPAARVAPRAVVAIDLLESDDARARRAGAALLRGTDR